MMAGLAAVVAARALGPRRRNGFPRACPPAIMTSADPARGSLLRATPGSLDVVRARAALQRGSSKGSVRNTAASHAYPTPARRYPWRAISVLSTRRVQGTPGALGGRAGPKRVRRVPQRSPKIRAAGRRFIP